MNYSPLVVAASLCLLAGCTSEYVANEATPNVVISANLTDALGAKQAAADAKAEADADAKAAKAQQIQDYLAGDGAGSSAAVKAGLESGHVVFGMTQAEVTLVANAVGAKSVKSGSKGVFATWEGVDCGGPPLDADKSAGHAAPLTVEFNNGKAARITSAEQ